MLQGTCGREGLSPKENFCVLLCDTRQRDNAADLNQEDGLPTMRTTAEAE